MSQPLAPTSGIVIAAPSSGSGKTTITLGLLRAMRDMGLSVTGAKCGPDYIDPRFHQAASGRECLNLDPFAMTGARIRSLIPSEGQLVVEGVMGLFDGAADGKGSTAELARILDLPIVLVVDAARTAQSIAALVNGFRYHDDNLSFAGVILNNVGSDRHEFLLRSALAEIRCNVFGAIRRDKSIAHPARHLGLVQAEEREDLEQFIQVVASRVSDQVDIPTLLRCCKRVEPDNVTPPSLTPPAQRIAIAADPAFAFAYPHIARDWHAKGAEITTFSPLADQGPEDCDFVVLPGGYPELYASKLASNSKFIAGMQNAAKAGVQIYGECGGYMTLGKVMIDADGVPHKMIGLLDLETSFHQRKLHLGYRYLKANSGPFAGEWFGHEFHYATTKRSYGPPLFSAKDAMGAELPQMGIALDNVQGSFAHIIDRKWPTKKESAI